MVFLHDSTEAEQRRLFGITDAVNHAEVLYDLHASSFRTHKGVESYCKWYAEMIDAPSEDVVGTFWASRIGRYVAFVHWCIARGKKHAEGWDITIYYSKNREYREPAIHYVVGNAGFQAISEWTDSIEELQSFYMHYVTPMIHTFATVTALRTSMLWGQLVDVVPYYLKEVSKFEREEIAEEMMSHWKYISEKAPAEVFSEKKNPFPYRCINIPNPQSEDEPMHTKSACCLYFKLSENYCYRCPRLTPEKRNVKYEELKQL